MEYNKGDKVFCLDSFGYIDEGIIKKCENTVDSTIPGNTCKVYTVNGSIGEIKFLEKDIFKTRSEAFSEKAARSKAKRQKYESEINNLPQLFSFMISQMYCEEYTDYEAIEAAKNKIKEITGVDIDNEES